jgi:hypothetical protein
VSFKRLVGRPGEIKAVRRLHPSRLNDRKRCGRVDPRGAACVDAGRDQGRHETLSEPVVRDGAQIAHRDAEPGERDRGVEWTAAGEQTEPVAVDVRVEQ